MKKTLIALAMLSAASASYADRNYECYRYVDGKPAGGYVNVTASSKSDAETKAYQKYKDMGKKVHSVNCK